MAERTPRRHTIGRWRGWLASVLVSACLPHPAPPPLPASVTRAQLHMGTVVTITAVAANEAVAGTAVAAGFEAVHRLDALLSTWRPDSDVSRVNESAGRAPVPVAAETMLLVHRALAIAAMTDGGFNIAIGPAVEAWGIPEHPRVPARRELARLARLVDLSGVRADERSGTIFLTRVGMRLDVGGIGKGFAADAAVAAMRTAGATGGLVALSGDIATFGRQPDGTRFRVGIRHPRQEDTLLATVELENEAISTAGDYERSFVRHGTRYHHILDPRTLQPSRLCQSVTVIAPEGALADGLDTGVFVMGPESGLRLVERLPDVAAVVVDREGRLHVSSRLEGRLQLEPAAP